MQVDRVLQWMTEFDTASPTYIDYKQMRDFAAVYDTKNIEEKKKLVKAESHSFHLLPQFHLQYQPLREAWEPPNTIFRDNTQST